MTGLYQNPIELIEFLKSDGATSYEITDDLTWDAKNVAQAIFKTGDNGYKSILWKLRGSIWILEYPEAISETISYSLLLLSEAQASSILLHWGE